MSDIDINMKHIKEIEEEVEQYLSKELKKRETTDLDWVVKYLFMFELLYITLFVVTPSFKLKLSYFVINFILVGFARIILQYSSKYYNLRIGTFIIIMILIGVPSLLAFMLEIRWLLNLGQIFYLLIMRLLISQKNV